MVKSKFKTNKTTVYALTMERSDNQWSVLRLPESVMNYQVTEVVNLDKEKEVDYTFPYETVPVDLDEEESHLEPAMVNPPRKIITEDPNEWDNRNCNIGASTSRMQEAPPNQEEPLVKEERSGRPKKVQPQEPLNIETIRIIQAKTLENIINEIVEEEKRDDTAMPDAYDNIIHIIRVLRTDAQIEKSGKYNLSKLAKSIKKVIKKLPKKLPDENTRNTIHILAAQGVYFQFDK